MWKLLAIPHRKLINNRPKMVVYLTGLNLHNTHATLKQFFTLQGLKSLGVQKVTA